MQVENCPHEQYICVTAGGSLGEIKDSFPLTPDTLSIVRKDPSRAEALCPHGNIQCGICGMPLFEAKGQNLPSATSLTGALKEGPVKPRG